jgi:multisubunit Na+/H+ antiporter MnhF subunit
MKALANIIAVIGLLLVVYAVVSKFIAGPTSFGYIYALDPKTVILGANTLLLIAILANIYSKK